jgi:hypothetical protein
MLKSFFLKKKRFLSKKYDSFFSSVKVGMFLFIEYLSLDFDLLHKYKLYGLCLGLKSSFMMSVCYLNSAIINNHIKYTFFLFSPFVFNIKIMNSLKVFKFKVYDLVPKSKMFKQIV